MGVVFKARQAVPERLVALKMIRLDRVRGDAEEEIRRFHLEAQAAAKLEHPGIVPIFEVGEHAGQHFYSMGLVEGGTLADLVRDGPLPPREAAHLVEIIATAVQYAHSRNIVHRDLKPGNVMLMPSRTIKVLDFGLAKDANGAGHSTDFTASPTVAVAATSQGIILGTAPYMSPEQARGKPADRRTDVWALGCILMECLTGRPTFAGETVSDVIARILEREPDWSAIPATTPPRLRDLVRRCLTKEADDRPRDIGDLRRELNAIALDLSGPTRPTLSASEVPSLAVLYFENLAQDPDSDYFCSGVTEDILTDLSKIKGLKVASRNAVLRYRGSPTDLQQVARDLGVGAVLEGSVRRAGDRIRITTQLVNASDGFQLWAERYDRKLDDVFGVQEEIASSIAAALRVALSPAEVETLTADRPSDARAYDLYLKARQRYGQYTAESLREALELFQQAIGIDPNYARAWAGVADCHGQMLQWGFASRIEEGTRLGLEAARRATSLNPRLADGYKAEGLVLRFTGDFDGARAALTRAVEADPHHVPALINLAVDAVSRADLAAAERLIRRSLEVDPQEPFATTWLAWLTRMTHRPDECRTLVDRLRHLSDDPFYVTAVYLFRAWLCLDRNDLAGATEAIRAGRADRCRTEDLRALEALLAAREGCTQDAAQALSDLDQATLGSGSMMIAATAAVRVGDLDRAIGLLNRRILRDLSPCMARLEPELHPVLDHRPFAPRRWNVTLVWPLQAPMIDEACYSVFREVRIESGRPQGSDILRGISA
jgi:serine/threonine protein kinase/Tfp pilus assembly protein PilF